MIVKDESDGVGFGGGGRWLRGLGSLIRRKQVDSVHLRRHAQLARKLSAVDLVGIGVGATIGAGVYILIGTVAREQAGPSLVLSLLFAGIAAGLSAFCYAELACPCPSAESAYHYTYICIGEGVAWLAGWSLILEYTIGASAVARGITPNLALFFGGEDNLPSFLVHINKAKSFLAIFCYTIVAAAAAKGRKTKSRRQNDEGAWLFGSKLPSQSHS
ncbi:hypothetical protein Fmac_029483 [Flemingia macrophylla]|uniref:Uncharacterized protein n=1 Tax=Flemingia macrophylla TaxID=520843 RepID=A0ABD1LAF9_9FABA